MARHKEYFQHVLSHINLFVHKIPVVLRAGVVFLFIQLVITIPLWVFQFPAQSDALFFQLILIVFSYFFMSPVFAGCSYVSRELNTMGLVKWVIMLFFLYLSICLSRLSIFNIDENEYFTLQALILSGFPLIIFVAVALIRSRATTID